MGKINIEINGRKATGDEGETILETAERSGFQIPSLCRAKELKPTGVCRICSVEVEGYPRLVASCHTPIVEGMVIHTESPRVLLSRKVILGLLMAGHTGPCVVDPLVDECELHRIAAASELEPPRFLPENPRSYPVEGDNPYVIRDLSKCILCRRCVAACEEIAKQSIFSIGYRGSDTKIIVGRDSRLNMEVCRDCGICVDSCPTSALRRVSPEDQASASRPQEKKEVEKPLYSEGLLDKLKKEQQEYGFISETAMIKLSSQFKTTLGEIYGLASFYSFLSTEPRGRNIIRICRSLPCFLKEGAKFLAAVKKILHILPGETTADGKFSLELTNCIGACDQAPAIMVNHDIHGRLTMEDIPGILESYK